MNFRKYRIRGRISSKEETNNIYPKFLVLNENPFLQSVILNPTELDGVDESERIFEPIEIGLGIKSEVMYVKDEIVNKRTYLFSYPIETEIIWGSYVVSFDQNVDYEGNVYQE